MNFHSGIPGSHFLFWGLGFFVVALYTPAHTHTPHPPREKRTSVLKDPIKTRTNWLFWKVLPVASLELHVTVYRERPLTETTKPAQNTLSSCSFTGSKVKAFNLAVFSLALTWGCDSWGQGKASCWSGRGCGWLSRPLSSRAVFPAQGDAWGRRD